MSMGQQPRRHSALNDALADEIRARRRAVEMSQADLGKRAGMSRAQVIRIENHERVIDVTQADAFARALGVGMVELFQCAQDRVNAAQAGPVDQPKVAAE
jgi:transcriptional regulator with XRE-family HTH domain